MMCNRNHEALDLLQNDRLRVEETECEEEIVNRVVSKRRKV